MKCKLYSQRFFKKWLAAAAVGLLAVIAISSPVNAETFTLSELVAGESFTVGGVTFSNWFYDPDESTALANIVTIETINDAGLPGFRLHGNNELVGDDQKLKYGFVVSTPNAVMSGALLWVTDFVALPLEDAKFDIFLRDDTPEAGLEVHVRNSAELIPIDAEALKEPLPGLPFDATVETRTTGNAIVAVNTYETRIILLAEGRRTNLGFLPGAVYLPLLLN